MHQDRKAWAVFILSFGIAMTSLQDTFMKYLSGDYPFHQMQAIRCAIAIVLLAGAGALSGGLAPFDWRMMRPVLARGLILGVGSALYYVSLAALPMADATAIYFALPLLVAAFSGIMLREKVQSWRWLAALAGFAGVLIAIRPGSNLFEPAAVLTLSATCLYAVGNLFTRRISPSVPPLVIVLFGAIGYMSVGLVIALIFGTGRFYSGAHPSLAFLTRGWVMPSLRDWGLLAGFGIATATGFFAYAEAYRKAPASFIAPFEYSAMIWAILFGWWIFGDVPAQTTLIGSAVIIGSGLFLGTWEWRQQKRAARM